MRQSRMRLRKLLFAPLAVLLLLTACGSAKTQETASTGNLIIYYDSSVGSRALLDAVRSYGSEVIYQYKNFNAIAVRIPRGKTVAKAMEYYKKVRGVLAVNEDMINQLSDSPAVVH